MPPPLNAGLEWSFAWPGLGPDDSSPLGTLGGGIGAVGVDGVSCTGCVDGAVVACGAVLGGGAVVGTGGVSVLLHPVAKTSALAHAANTEISCFIALLQFKKEMASKTCPCLKSNRSDLGGLCDAEHSDAQNGIIGIAAALLAKEFIAPPDVCSHEVQGNWRAHRSPDVSDSGRRICALSNIRNGRRLLSFGLRCHRLPEHRLKLQPSKLTVSHFKSTEEMR